MDMREQTPGSAEFFPEVVTPIVRAPGIGQDRRMDDVFGLVIGLVGLALGFLSIPPLVLARRDRLSHVRTVWARAEPIIGENGGWTHSTLGVTNGSRWPVWDVVVIHPESESGADFSSVGPFESRTKTVDGDVAVFPETITLQVTDSVMRTWLWTPEASTLTPIPPPITPLARLVQFSYRFFPEWLKERFVRLPDRALVFLWGYHPEHGDGRDVQAEHMQRARRVLIDRGRLADEVA